MTTDYETNFGPSTPGPLNLLSGQTNGVFQTRRHGPGAEFSQVLTGSRAYRSRFHGQLPSTVYYLFFHNIPRLPLAYNAGLCRRQPRRAKISTLARLGLARASTAGFRCKNISGALPMVPFF